MRAYSKDIEKIPCGRCWKDFSITDLHLHEIIPTGAIYEKDVLDMFPVELHLMLCPDCHDTYVHNRAGISEMLISAAKLWGRERVIKAIDFFNSQLPVPIPNTLIDYDKLEGKDGQI